MSPKAHDPQRETDWENFLLGCTNCNSTKSKKITTDNELLWPDRDNTFLALIYRKGGFVLASESLDADIYARTRRLIDLVGLDRHGARGWPDPTDKDHRWRQREEAWSIALGCLAAYDELDRSVQALQLVVTAALGFGFFSVWMHVFGEHPKVRKRLIEAFAGTAKDAFDETGSAVPRPGGAI